MNALALQPDGKVIIGGVFTTVNGVARNNIARLNADGTLDTAFGNGLVGASTAVDALALQPDGKVIIGGLFSTVNGITRFNIARLNADGTLDTTFGNGLVGANATVNALALQSDGKILLGGAFITVNGVTRNRIGRLNADGTLDTTFGNGQTGASFIVYALALQTDGKVIIGGGFGTVNGVARSGIARLNTDGTLDTTFGNGLAGVNSQVRALALQPDGKIIIGGFFSTVNGIERQSIARLQSNMQARRTAFDFDGDGKTDFGVFRPSNGVWYLQNSTSGFLGQQFGISTDKLVPADYDGDGKTDIAVFRDGIWYLQQSSQGFTGVQFGLPDDIPMPADYDGDGKADIAVFRPSNGAWYFLMSSQGFAGVQFGQNGDKPVAADYDGDGKADVAVVRQSGGASIWYILGSSQGFLGVQFGNETDRLVPADFDGDGKADIAVYRNGIWYILQSQLGFAAVSFGIAEDKLVVGDYDGDGKADIAVWRPSTGAFYVLQSQAGFTGFGFGQNGDFPIASAFVP